ncbi:MAG: 5-formyltetrahydrofolate cyclo-ligase [Bacteroidales bacterium]|nr:5-formyltetrahydrofolate cyclo-ligase [Bacteroidales bacterium]
MKKSMEMTKREVRLRALAARDALPAQERKRYSEEILQKVIRLEAYQAADALLTYVNFRSEVETEKLIEHAFDIGKAVFVPAVSGWEMEFFRIASWNDLKSGYQGILEPKQEAENSYRTWREQRKGTQAATLLCLPGAAFDRQRHRIGYGGGYYDRYLSALFAAQEKTETIRTTALAYSCQVLAEIPQEAHDLQPERIVTEREIIEEKTRIGR